MAGFGAAVTVSAYDLTAFFLGIETLSIALYCLCGFYRTEMRSTESALKYLLVGAFSTVILLYGIAFVFGASGSTNYDVISRVIAAGDKPFVLLGSVFIVAGLAFKLALIPFHIYTPDVYEGAPTIVSGFLATIVKLAAIGAATRLFWFVLEPVSQYWEAVWVSLCVMSIVLGNLGALQQKTIKKLLAYSSISHAGFLGLGLLVAGPGEGSLFPMLSYLVVYSFMTLGIFALVSFVEKRESLFYLEDLKGLGLRRVGVGILFALFALGLAGIPPLAGFMIKFWIFQALIEQGHWWVALSAVVGSVIGLAYYLKILMLLFMTSEEEKGAALGWAGLSDRVYSLRLVLLIAALITLVGGLRPDFYADWIFATIALK
jgi:NADH-quinone oxidoreductase subunit N